MSEGNFNAIRGASKIARCKSENVDDKRPALGAISRNQEKCTVFFASR
jgi:hypothetical protein